jgi:ribosomal protein S7
MKSSTLHKIARQIHDSRRIVERRTVNEMTAALESAAGDAKSKREAAYLIMTEAFDMIDDEDEHRRRIDDILSGFEGSWMPAREEVAP